MTFKDQQKKKGKAKKGSESQFKESVAYAHSFKRLSETLTTSSLFPMFQQRKRSVSIDRTITKLGGERGEEESCRSSFVFRERKAWSAEESRMAQSFDIYIIYSLLSKYK